MPSRTRTVPISALKPDTHNANKGTERGRKMLEESLRRLGAGRSIVADRHSNIVAGNKTLEVAAELGIPIREIESDGTELIVVKRTDWDLYDPEHPEAREYAYSDNRVSEVDFQADPAVIAEDARSGAYSLDWLYTEAELAEVFKLAPLSPDDEAGAPPVQDEPPDESRAAELAAAWGTRPGQVWQIGPHRLVIGDCTDPAAWHSLMGREVAALSFASPPYNVATNARLAGYNASGPTTKYSGSDTDDLGDADYLELLCASTELSLRYCRYLALNIQQLANNKLAVLDWLHTYREHYADVLIWAKGASLERVHAAPAMPENVMNAAFEFVYFLGQEALPSRNIKTASFRGTVENVYVGPSQHENEFAADHAATFPLHLPEYIFNTFTCPGDIVVDHFLGTGTSLVAAEQTARIGRGIERDPGYAALTLERMSKATQHTPRCVGAVAGSAESAIFEPAGLAEALE